jgi:hypothetical protein
MDKQTAKEILRRYRPGMADGQDPEMAEALALAREDGELGQWLEAQRDFNVAMREGLKSIPVPPNLRGKILQAETARTGKILWLNRVFLPLAAAAAVVLAFGTWFYFISPAKNSFPAYRERIVKSAQRGYNMAMNSTNLETIHQFILAKQYPDYALTAPLAKLKGEGCATLEWHGQKVSMICLNAKRGRDLFLFVLDDAQLRKAPTSTAPEFAQIHRLMTASWSENGKLYILAGPGSEADLKKFLQPS